MLALLSILFAMLLLGLTVYGLHRYQTMEVEFNVDRSAPLPPLDIEAEIPRKAEEKPTSAILKESRPAIAAKPVPKQAKSAPVAAKSWQDAVTKLKNAGDFAEAARLCEQQMPLWGAYNQLCMLIRSEMKASPQDMKGHARQIERLYKTAAVAELLHDKTRDSDKLSNHQLRKLDLAKIAALEFPYAEIGYAHLRLIRKSDIKHMVELWGRPVNHRTPREFHSAWWQKQAKS